MIVVQELRRYLLRAAADAKLLQVNVAEHSSMELVVSGVFDIDGRSGDTVVAPLQAGSTDELIEILAARPTVAGWFALRWIFEVHWALRACQPPVLPERQLGAILAGISEGLRREWQPESRARLARTLASRLAASCRHRSTLVARVCRWVALVDWAAPFEQPAAFTDEEVSKVLAGIDEIDEIAPDVRAAPRAAKSIVSGVATVHTQSGDTQIRVEAVQAGFMVKLQGLEVITESRATAELLLAALEASTNVRCCDRWEGDNG